MRLSREAAWICNATETIVTAMGYASGLGVEFIILPLATLTILLRGAFTIPIHMLKSKRALQLHSDWILKHTHHYIIISWGGINSRDIIRDIHSISSHRKN